MKKIEEKKILINIVGILECIKNDSITITEGEKWLFSPRVVEFLKNEGCNKKILEIIEEACELEDIETIIPQKLAGEIIKLKERAIEELKFYELFENEQW